MATLGRRAIPLAKLIEAQTLLQEALTRPVPPKSNYSQTEAVEAMSKDIIELVRHGYALDQICDLLKGKGIEVRPQLVGRYVRSTKNIRKESTQGRLVGLSDRLPDRVADVPSDPVLDGTPDRAVDRVLDGTPDRVADRTGEGDATDSGAEPNSGLKAAVAAFEAVKVKEDKALPRGRFKARPDRENL